MIKKYMYIALLTLLVAMLSVGCGSEEVDNSETTETENTETESSTDTTAETNTEGKTENEREYYSEAISHMEYIGFEECVGFATHIAEAKCVDVYTEGQFEYAVFELIESLKGEFREEKIIICANTYLVTYVSGLPSSAYSFRQDATCFEVGKEYLLLLEDAASVYAPFDYYYSTGEAFIPKESVEEATILGGVDLRLCNYGGTGVSEDYDRLKSYTRDLIAQNPPDPDVGNKWEYIRSNKLEDIVEQTNIILKVTINSHWKVGMLNDREWCICSVTETLKGKEITGTIQVIVPIDSIVTGEEYIFMLYQRSEKSDYYLMSSKHSIYPVTDTEKVKEIEALIEQSK